MLVSMWCWNFYFALKNSNNNPNRIRKLSDTILTTHMHRKLTYITPLPYNVRGWSFFLANGV